MENQESCTSSVKSLSITPVPFTKPNSATPTTPLPNPPTPTRPAPPSPAISRRTSQVPSISGAGGSDRGSRRNSRRTSGLRDSLTRAQLQSSQRLSQTLSTIPTATFPPKTPTQTTTRKLWTIKIRDFGFGVGDDKHRGLGPDEYVPKANRVKYLLKVLNAHLRSSAFSALSASEQPEEEDEDEFWDEDDYNYDFDGQEASTSSSNPEGEGVSYEGEYYDEDQPLLPGLYRALYAFVPEGPTEKALEEGELVRVVGRGGGSGWAVVVVEEQTEGGGEGRKHALVPESYLEIVEADPPGLDA